MASCQLHHAGQNLSIKLRQPSFVLRGSCRASSRCRESFKVQALNVVVTGSTKGIGAALAEQFVKAGDSIIITSRNEKSVNGKVKELESLIATGAKVKGLPCNVSTPGDVAALAKYAQTQLGEIDIWINNAGTNSYKYKALSELEDEDIVNIVQTNVLGVMLCCKEAIKMMAKQNRIGHIFNMDGAGADGSPTPRFAAYGATKRGLGQLGKSLQAELKQGSMKNVCVHNLSPGMVTTELLMSGGDTKVAKFFINCLADEPETVALTLVPQIRKVALDAQNSGKSKPAYIRYLTKSKAYTQIFGRLLLGQRKNRFLQEQ